MIRINLLPVRQAQRIEEAKRQVIFAGIGLALVLGLCGFSFVNLAGDVSAAEETTAALESDIQRLKKIIGQVEEFKAKKAELQKKIQVIEKLKKNRTGPVHLLDDIAEAVPDKAWIKSLTEKGVKVNLVGQAINWESIADFTEKLRRSAFIERVEVGPTKRVAVGDLFVQEFLLIIYQKEDKPVGEDDSSSKKKGKKKGKK